MLGEAVVDTGPVFTAIVAPEDSRFGPGVYGLRVIFVDRQRICFRFRFNGGVLRDSQPGACFRTQRGLQKFRALLNSSNFALQFLWA